MKLRQSDIGTPVEAELIALERPPQPKLASVHFEKGGVFAVCSAGARATEATVQTVEFNELR